MGYTGTYYSYSSGYGYGGSGTYDGGDSYTIDGGDSSDGYYTYEGCANDDSIGDSYDDTCSEYYDAAPEQCGNYDTDEFAASSLCCACMGYTGSWYSYSSGYGYGGSGIYDGGDSYTIDGGNSSDGYYYYDGCSNDDTIGDSYDDTCSEYYDAAPEQCGNYDTDEFAASSLCCACMGYSGTWYSYSSGYGYGGSGIYDGGDYTIDGGNSSGGYYTYEGCANDDTIGDSYDDTCSSYYDAAPEQCGNYDTDDFVAADLCCACMGYTGYYTMYGYGSGYGYGYGNGGGQYGIEGGDSSTWAPEIVGGDESTYEPVVYDGCTNDDSLGD
jgi:hypothetical protein